MEADFSLDIALAMEARDNPDVGRAPFRWGDSRRCNRARSSVR